MKGKLVFVIPSLASGGAERVVCSLSNSFLAKGYEVTILLLIGCKKPTYFVHPDVKMITMVHERVKHNLKHRAWYGVKTFFKLFYFLFREKPNIVFGFQTSANLWSGAFCNILGIPYVVSERTSPERTIFLKPRLLQRVYAIIYARAKAVIGPSTGILDCLKRNKYFKHLHNLYLIRNYVERTNSYLDKKLHPNKFVLAAGRLEFVKGFDRLIDSFSQVKSPGIDLLIAGRGKEKDKLATRINTLGLDRKVFLIGEVENIHDYYKQCELFVLPSRNEGYPNVLIEAMSVGCPCIAVDCEFGPSEIIRDGENGLLISNDNGPLLTDTIDKVLQSDSLRLRIADTAKEVLITNSYERILNEWEQLIIKYAS